MFTIKNPEQEESDSQGISIEEIIQEAQLNKDSTNSYIQLGSSNRGNTHLTKSYTDILTKDTVDDIVPKTNSQHNNTWEKIFSWTKTCCSKKNLLIGGSALGGVGVGLAMMPIFNEEVEHLEDYGINVHNNQPWLIASTINTLLLMSAYSACHFYKYFSTSSSNNKIELSGLQKKALLVSKLCAVSAAILPVSLLWNIELQDQEIEGTSGFDQFIAWATFTTAPLVFFKALSTYQSLEKYIASGQRQSTELNSLGAKIATYGIDGASLIARGISFTHVFKELLISLGVEEDTALGASIVIGGVIGNSLCGISEHSKLKALFKAGHEGFTPKEIIFGILAGIEAGWFSLPAISAGLEATEGWNPLVRGALFVPLFLSHANTEATEIYLTLMPHSHPHTSEYNSVIPLVGDGDQEWIEQ